MMVSNRHRPQGKGGVTAAVVKLDALTNAVGATPENHHLGFDQLGSTSVSSS
jgi:hypothetical protein